MDALLVSRFEAEYSAQVEASPLSSLEWLVDSTDKPHEMTYLRVTHQDRDGHWWVTAVSIPHEGNESPEGVTGLVKASVNRVMEKVRRLNAR